MAVCCRATARRRGSSPDVYKRQIRYTDGALTIAPTPDKSLDWAKATYDSPAGRIVSGWRYDGDVVNYEFEIPANLTADVTPVSYTHLDVYKRQRKQRLFL